MKTIYYYQTFCGLDKLFSHVQDIDTIIVSSIHFGSFKNDPYIHLNNYDPESPKFDEVWKEINLLHSKGVQILLMVGGAGGAYGNLFKDFDIYYPLLFKLLRKYNFISGIDLDIEEEADIKDVKKLMNQLIKDFGEDFTLTMAPVADSLMTDGQGMGGFSYKELYNSEEGKYIKWFNTQCYNSYTLETYDSIIKNGYPPEKVVFGMLSGDYDDFNTSLNEIKKVVTKYPKMNGAMIWEYITSPPDKNDPSQWCSSIKTISNDIDYANRGFLGIFGP